MTYEEAKTILEWAAQVQIGEVARYHPEVVLSALAVIVLEHDRILKTKTG